MEKIKSAIVAAGLGAFVPLTANAQSPSPEIKMVSVQGGTFTMGYTGNDDISSRSASKP